MKKSMLLLCLFVTAQFFGQTEFPTYENGLIYNEKSMNKLEFIVDSLNLQYKYCKLNKTFYSKYQTIAHIVKLDSINIKQAKQDMDNNISLEKFLLKYPEATIERDILVIKFKYTNYQEEELIEYSQLKLNGGYGMEITQTNANNKYEKSLNTKWIHDDYSGKSLRAFYFPEAFHQSIIKEPYNRYIGYANCLIDTTTTKFLESSEYGHASLPDHWQKLSLKKQEKLLKKMRSTRVVGSCSMDQSPRIHAMNIALLSAETTNWNIFLRSHLDIMNDRFDRISDGSYAYGRRKTYIKELEALNINVNDIIFGITLRVENPSANHYYGKINRLGRAISESKNRKLFEEQILKMIEDEELDTYNRILFYYLFLNYNGYLDNINEQIKNQERLKSALSKLPLNMYSKIKLKDIEKE